MLCPDVSCVFTQNNKIIHALIRDKVLATHKFALLSFNVRITVSLVTALDSLRIESDRIVFCLPFFFEGLTKQSTKMSTAKIDDELSLILHSLYNLLEI